VKAVHDLLAVSKQKGSEGILNRHPNSVKERLDLGFKDTISADSKFASDTAETPHSVLSHQFLRYEGQTDGPAC
jgi:hypothetical protein